MTAGLIEKLAWDPTRIRKLESGGVRLFQDQSGYRGRTPPETENKKEEGSSDFKAKLEVRGEALGIKEPSP